MLTVLLWICAAMGIITLGVCLIAVIFGTGVALVWFVIKAIICAFPVVVVILLVIWAWKMWDKKS